MRALIAITLGKLAAWAIRTLKLGNATTVPGQVALAIYPALLSRHFANQLRHQCGENTLAITGTNGKTTTAGLIASCLTQAGYVVCHNTLGANMVGGITSALVLAANSFGKLPCNALVLEVDEANLPHITQALPIHQVVVTNLFRDQLDRYGELDTTAQFIRDGLAHCQQPTTVYLNAHDDRILAMAEEVPNATPVAFGMTVASVNEQAENDLLDLVPCRFEAAAWQSTPKPPDDWENTVVNQITPCETGYQGQLNDTTIHLPVDGLFNAMNAVAAMAVARQWGLPAPQFEQGLANYQGVFGRSETLTIGGKQVKILLIKNPVGATEVCRMVAADPKARLLVALNDNDADGRDVSWIWDAGFELLVNTTGPIICSGQRADDMAVRLKYAGLASENLTIIPNVADGLNQAVQDCPTGHTLYALVTYTNLLALRATIGYS